VAEHLHYITILAVFVGSTPSVASDLVTERQSLTGEINIRAMGQCVAGLPIPVEFEVDGPTSLVVGGLFNDFLPFETQLVQGNMGLRVAHQRRGEAVMPVFIPTGEEGGQVYREMCPQSRRGISEQSRNRSP